MGTDFAGFCIDSETKIYFTTFSSLKMCDTSINLNYFALKLKILQKAMNSVLSSAVGEVESANTRDIIY